MSLLITLLLEAFAAFLALLHGGGVQTDEAKYLLNIPYPHPPLLRFVLSATEWIPFQEMFWRFLFASLLLQAVWIVRDMGRDLSCARRLTLCACWLLSSAVLFQAGTVMLAVPTAIFAFLFLRLMPEESKANQGDKERHERPSSVVGLLWLAALLSTFQAVLFLPIVAAVVWRMRVSLWWKACVLLAPVVILFLFSLSNPLTLFAVQIQAGKDVGDDFLTRAQGLLRIWMLGGSGILSFIGTLGLILRRQWVVLFALAFVCVYVFIGRYDYYAVFFVPLFITGVHRFLSLAAECPSTPMRRWMHVSLPLLTGAGTVLLFTRVTAFPLPGPARAVLQAVGSSLPSRSYILVNGPFGHEWQYESRMPIRRYRSDLVDGAAAIICLRPCEDGVQWQSREWERLSVQTVETWAHDAQ